MTIRLERLAVERLDLFKDLLGSSDFGGCFCAFWTSYGPDWEARCSNAKQPNYAVTAADLKGGRHVGYFAYDGEKLIGWTGAGPKTSFPLLESKLGSRLSDFSPKTWSIGCIAIKSAFRGRGYPDKVVSAVIDLAVKSGAKAVEAYPVRPFHEPRVYRGTEGLYRRIGFEEISAEMDGDHSVLLMQKKVL
jgi:GNAT superfamily N-acetyltransferase